MRLLKLSTARAVDVVVVLSSDHIAGATGKTLTIYAAKNGGTPAAITPTVTELDGTNMPGVYSLALTTTHTNTLGDLTLHVTAASCDPTSITFQVVTDLPGDTIATVNGFAANSITAAAIADGAIDNATFAADTGRKSVRSSTAQAGAAGSITLDASASSTTDFYVGAWVYITGGTGAGQTRLISAYNGTTKVATIARNWATNPDNTSTFAILPTANIYGVFDVASIQSGLATSSALATVQADTDDIQTRLPAALVSGRLDVSVGAYQSGQAPLQPTTAGRTLDVTATGEAGIDWANIGSPTTTVNLSGTTVKTATDVETDTQDIQSRLPAALVSGRIDSSVGAMASGVLTSGVFAAGAINAAAIATDAIDADALKADAVTEIQSGLATSSALALVQTDTTSLLAAVATLPTAAENADAVWDEGQSGHTTAGTFGKYLDTEVSGVSGGTVPTAAEVADAVWDEARAGHVTAGTFGQGVASVQGDVTGSAGSVTGAVGSVGTGGITSGSFAAGAIDAAAIATDALGALELAAGAASEIATAVRTELTTELGRIDTTISSRLPTSSYTAPPSVADTADAVWDEARAGHATAGTFGQGVASVQGDVTGAVGSVAAGGITAASIATGAIDADAVASDAVTEIQAGLSTLDAAGVRAAVGMATANLDAQLAGISDVTAKVDTMLETDSGGTRFTEDALRELFTHIVENGMTFDEVQRLQNTLVTIASGMGTSTNTFRDLADTKDRVVGLNVDANGNRVGPITYDVTP